MAADQPNDEIWVTAVTGEGTIGVASSIDAAEAIAEQYCARENYVWVDPSWTEWSTPPETTQLSRLVCAEDDGDVRQEVFMTSGPLNQIFRGWYVPAECGA